MKKIYLKGNRYQYTIFESWSGISEKEFKEKAKFYFDGFELHKIIDMIIEKKQSRFWVTLILKKEDIILKFSNRHQKIYFYSDDQVPKIYEKIEDFLNALDYHRQEQQRILKNYEEQIQKKITEIKKEAETIKELENKIAETMPEILI